MLLLALLALACKDQERIDREEALKTNLAQVRRALTAYRSEHGTYPHALTDLVPKYLPALPADPIGGGDWRVTTEETVQPNNDFQTTTTTAAAPRTVIIDVRSNAPGTDRNGVPYANY